MRTWGLKLRLFDGLNERGVIGRGAFSGVVLGRRLGFSACGNVDPIRDLE
jgi:hypothetical protein